ncbi:MAG: DUF1343 domain-containing protein [Chitinivibrionales bacterium]|nr:DUF1343 domain-containing protein [Chitinivibrionales bacterium]
MIRTRSGLEIFCDRFPKELHGVRLGVLCHAPSIDSSYRHIITCLKEIPECTLGAIFGPQHGLFGQTQDNMVEWEGNIHPQLKTPVYSLYGAVRKPTPAMLDSIDALVIDLQDVGARPYTYIWTVKLCLEACGERNIPVWVLDRPNPIGALDFDGPLLSPDYFSFVGGAEIPLCHRMTIGEIALLLKQTYSPATELHVVWMENWWRSSLWFQTGLPWVLPSPNMPTLDTAIVYPGMVLLEATNLSEGRGTTRPFELIGAPYLRIDRLLASLSNKKVPGTVFREHNFIPTFQKWKGDYCPGIQVHVTNVKELNPVFLTATLLASVIETAGEQFAFKDPPYEYETEKMPFDILSGGDKLRKLLSVGAMEPKIREEWKDEYKNFFVLFNDITHYPELL